MTAFTAIDLSKLPIPDIVEQLDFEEIVSSIIDYLRSIDPTFTATVESDPAYKQCEAFAFREMVLRQRVNDACKAVMLAYAKDADLDQIGANFQVERLVVDPGNPDAIPPVPPTYEPDEDFRRRIQLSFEGFTTAGSTGSYIFHSLSADGQVKDASAISPLPGDVLVSVLSRTGDGAAPPELVAAVDAALTKEEVRPLTDNVTVQSATITTYDVVAKIYVYPGPDSEVVRQEAEDSASAYVASMHKLGYDVPLSGLYAAIHRDGVQRVVLEEPLADINCDETEAAYCTSVTVTVEGVSV